MSHVTLLLVLVLVMWRISYQADVCVYSAGCRLLQDLEVKHVEVDACSDAQSAAEGAVLGLFQYDQLKAKKKTKVSAQLHGRWKHSTSWCRLTFMGV